MGSILKAASEKRKKEKEQEAKRRGRHARRDGRPLRHNPYVRAKTGNAPKKHKYWKRGWKEADKEIEEGSLNEYDDS